MFFKVIGRMTAGFFAGLGKFLYNAIRWIGKKPLTFVTTVLVIGLVALLAFSTNFFGLAGSGSSDGVVRPTERTMNPDGKSTEFLNSLRDVNADKMYEMLSPDFKTLLAERGITNAGVMKTLMEEKLEEITSQKGGRLNYRFSFSIGTKYSDGSVEDVYDGQISSGSVRSNVQFAFKVKDGKVLDVQSTEPVTIAALGINRGESKAAAQIGAVSNNRSANAEKFMVGLTTYDAEKIWETLADSYKEYLTANGVTRDAMAKFFDEQIKKYNADQTGKNGQKIGYDGFVYYRTINFPNGVSSHAYGSILSIGDNPLEPNYTLVLDSTNKIIRIGTVSPADPILSALLKRNSQQ
jgi:hypothetical protein